MEQNAAPIFTLTPAIVWGAFGVILLIWVIATLVLDYHWKTYGIDKVKITVMRSAYLAGSIFFLAIILLSALRFSLS
jgi:hypothetical protein